MHTRGVVYDAGTVYGRGPLTVCTVPRFDPDLVRGELEIIATDLHCNAVRIRGRDLGRLHVAAGHALSAGLELWLSPELFDHDHKQTLSYLGNAAVLAEQLRRDVGDRVVLSVGSELTLFMRGIVPGASVTKRFAALRASFATGGQVAPLREFLAAAAAAVRGRFGGRITYAALPFESVDWSLFDLVGVDHYRDDRVKDRYVQILEQLRAAGKPVVITEFGMRSYQGAASSGALGFGVADHRTVLLHQLPLVGRLVRPRLKPGGYVRDEELQAAELSQTLSILDAAGVAGAFVNCFADRLAPYSDDPRYDLDMSALSLVRDLGGRAGSSYPGMPWEPKLSFRAVADFYAAQEGRKPS
jgi:hypothetical protein